jgi:hypothetical protein
MARLLLDEQSPNSAAMGLRLKSAASSMRTSCRRSPQA